jgi:beta-phosphoglucomutase-like phosphatase (HAD superfamily)
MPPALMDFKKDTCAVVFDMDGVIVDSEPIHEQAFREIFALMGFGEHEHGIEFERYYGKSDRALWIDFIAKHHPKQPIEELLAWKQAHFLKLLCERKPIFEPIPALVAALAQRYPLAVASGSNHAVIDAVLGMRDLRRYFRAVASVQDVARPKPFPDVFLRAAELLGVSPSCCVVIEDSAAGVQAARDAGMRVIAITNSLKSDQLSQAHAVTSNYQEIERFLV